MLKNNNGALYIDAPRLISIPVQRNEQVIVKACHNGIKDIEFNTNDLRPTVQAEYAGTYTEPLKTELMYKYVTEVLWEFPELEGKPAVTFCSRERDALCACAFKSPWIYSAKCVDLQDIFSISEWWRKYCSDYWVNDNFNYNMTYWEGNHEYHEHFVRDGKLMTVPCESSEVRREHVYRVRATVIIKAANLKASA